ncbi:hypothetical protein [Halomonas cupida]|uniref:hypothetical protein n=1 Tax=Halomonas cupida TaxID=44933 RepID=UPI003A8E3635
MKETYTALREFGAAFLGPALTMYARAVEENGSGRLPVCLAREGWLIHKLLTRLESEGLVEFDHSPIYLKVSRTLLFRAMVGEPDIWPLAMKGSFSGSVLELLMKRFGFQMHEVFACLPPELLNFTLQLPEDAEKVSEWLEPHAERLNEQVKYTRLALKEYFSRSGLYDRDLMPLMLDLGYSGTIQKLCTKLLERDTDGLYFIATQAGKTEVNGHTATLKGVFREGVEWKEGYTMLERSLYFECLMTAPHGQVVDILETNDGNLIFSHGREASSQRYYQDLEAILDGAIDAVVDAMHKDIFYTTKEVEDLFEVFSTRPGALPQASWHLFTADDDISGNGMVNPLQIFGY